MTEAETPCILEEARFFDSKAKKWGHKIICFALSHMDRDCPGEGEIYSLPVADDGTYGDYAKSRASEEHGQADSL